MESKRPQFAIAKPHMSLQVAPLTARNAITMAELASIASEVIGRDVRNIVISDQAAPELKVAAGTPALHAKMLLETFQAKRGG